jgi:GNAT superfamily N-acetyltransferase
MSEVTIRSDPRPGDLGMITHLHGVHYAREYGLDTTFEPYVARPLSDFVLTGPDAGRLWLAEQDGQIVGSLAIVRTSNPGEAQLRWFLIVPGCRGTGLGRRLMDAAMAYCKDQALISVFLWSFNELDAALHLYRAHGFAETERTSSHLWGRDRTEIRMELRLDQRREGQTPTSS